MARGLPSKADILNALEEAGRPLHAGQLATCCEVSQTAYPKFLEALETMAERNQIRRLSGHRFAANPVKEAPKPTDQWEGVLALNPRGFGFVTSPGKEDVYVPPDAIGAALRGDRVIVSVINRSPRGAEGRLESIVSRRNPRVAGVLRKRGKSAWLEPDDTRIRGPIVVTSGAGRKEVKDGLAAVVSITRYPDFADENAEAELVSVLGVPGAIRTWRWPILVREQANEQHPEGAVREAEAMARKLSRVSLEGRRDLRDVPLPTIDPEDARDHDDAIWVEKRKAAGTARTSRSPT